MARDAFRLLLIGIGATATMDIWLLLMRRLQVPTPNFALVGRWIGHMPRGRWMHEAIARSPPIEGERALGWLAHYGIGIAFAGLLVAWAGGAWMHEPTLLPALGVGIATVAAPLFVMQPAMGAGLASRKTPAPLRNCLRSLANHTAFGVGLYLTAVLVAAIHSLMERVQ